MIANNNPDRRDLSQSRPIILLTRPKLAAARFADMCRAKLDDPKIICAPVIRIEILVVEKSLKPYTGLIFSSQNAVQAYLASWDQRQLPAYCVGDHTAKAARAAGMTAYSAKGSADDLVAMVQDAPAGRHLHIRGEHSRGGIAARLKQDEVIAYRQVPVALTDDARLVLTDQQEVILPLFSPRSARLFFAAAGKIAAPLRVIAISKAVASAVLDQKTTVAASPDAMSVLQEIKRYLDR